MKKIFLITLLFSYVITHSQNQIKTYALPPLSLIVSDSAIPMEPSTDSNFNPTNFNVGKNTDFTVRVSKDQSAWTTLFGYNTFTTDRKLQNRKKATFVSFDFSGTVYIEVTCNFQNVNFNVGNSLMIRPQSKNIIPYYKNGNVFKFAISNPSKLSIEVNGERDRNLQIFANPMNTYVPTGTDLKTFEPGIHTLSNSNLTNSKIYIKSGAVVIGDIDAKTGDEIYIEGGGILKGGIKIDGKNNVKIHGHGIIDLTNYAKEYKSKEVFLRRNGFNIINSNNIEIRGITVNDSQKTGILITDSDYITIDNFKLFTRVMWGDGIHMKGTSNVNINDCYLRTSDDCIAIYTSRRESWDTPESYKNRNAVNIDVKNTSLYADKAHPIEIGWHGNQEKDSNGVFAKGLSINYVYFENIDILEHDEEDGAFMGAMSVNCSDGNYCTNIAFTNIRVEDFTRGRLLSVNVEPAGLGAATTNGRETSSIHFVNVSYNGYGEYASSIKGLNCDRFVNGVHFENFTVNGTLITKLSDYMLNTNKWAYNITFQEGDNYSHYLPEGYYKIKNSQSYLQKIPNSPFVRFSLYPSDPENYNIWYISYVPNNFNYRIKSYLGDEYIENFQLKGGGDLCQSRRLLTYPKAETTLQEWKIVGDDSSGFTIINAYTRAYITNESDDLFNPYASPKNGESSQKWEFIPVNVPNFATMAITNNELTLYPNPVIDILTIDAGGSALYDINIADINGRIVKEVKYESQSSAEINLSGLESGMYIVTINSENGITTKKIVKQ